jgi:hypothetical protein
MTAISAPVQSVLELFKGPLASVRFADIDANGLATLAAEVEAAASEVQLQEEALAELRQGLAQRQEALLTLAQQALAYARVYAESDEPLLDELNRISLPRAAKPRKPSAAKTGAREGARTESLAEAPPGSAAAGSDAGPDTSSSNDPEPHSDTDEAELASEAVEVKRVPPRSGRKARGGAAQRSAAE